MADSRETALGVLDRPEPANAAPCRVSVDRVGEADDAYPHIVARLNDNWRVIEGRCGIQWILQGWNGSQWRGRRFHTERDALIRSCRESKARGGLFTVGDICEAGLRALEALPERHS